MGAAERNARALVGLELFDATWLVDLAALGLHLIVLGALVVRSAETPGWLGALMIAAGAVHLIDTTAYTVLAD